MDELRLIEKLRLIEVLFSGAAILLWKGLQRVL